MRKPAPKRWIYLAAGFFVVSSPASQASESESAWPRERNVPETLASVLCERTAAAGDLMANGLFDAQVDVVTLKPKITSAKITNSTAKDRAVALAQRSESLGFAYGTCQDGHAWAAAFAAPEAVTIKDSVVFVPRSAKALCGPKSLKVLFVPEKKGRSFVVPLTDDLTARLPEAKGYASVVCSPKIFPASGPREWALIPVGGAKSNARDIAPVTGFLNEAELLAWINQKRTEERLPELKLDRELTDAARGLLNGRFIRHDLWALNTAKTSLLKRGIEGLGENRVGGNNLAEAAGLLWMSPAHRDLILNPKADTAGLAVTKDEQGVFLVVLVGRRTPKPVARYQ